MSYTANYTGEFIDETVTKALSSVLQPDLTNVYDIQGEDPVVTEALQSALNFGITNMMDMIFIAEVGNQEI